MANSVATKSDDNPRNEYGETFAEAWARYRVNHPEVLASWGEQNGRWPKCRCSPCDPEKLRAQQA